MTATHTWYKGEPPEIRRLFGKSRIRHADIKGERELELIRLAKAGDRRARATLDQAHLPLVYQTVRRYFGHGVDADDLIQEGRMGLQHAIGKFDESHGVTFATYALRWVRHNAAIYLSQHCSDIRVAPKVRAAYGRMLRQGKTAQDLLASDCQDDRTLLANLDAVMPAARLDAPSQFAPDRVGGEVGVFGDRVAVDGPLPDEALDAARLRALREALVCKAVSSLPTQELEVVVRRYPLDEDVEPQSQVEIGQNFASANRGRGGEVTRQRIQQIEAAALSRLKARISALDPEGRILA